MPLIEALNERVGAGILCAEIPKMAMGEEWALKSHVHEPLEKRRRFIWDPIVKCAFAMKDIHSNWYWSLQNNGLRRFSWDLICWNLQRKDHGWGMYSCAGASCTWAFIEMAVALDGSGYGKSRTGNSREIAVEWDWIKSSYTGAESSCSEAFRGMQWNEVQHTY